MPVSRKYLDPETIARLSGLELRARSFAVGFRSGVQRSPYHGFSIEFAEHREYVPGDDVRNIDWRVFGRADRLYVKEHEEETNLSCHILVDASNSMAYRGAAAHSGRTKLEYSCGLAASLAYLLVHQQDAAGLITFDRQIRAQMSASTGRSHLNNLAKLLEDTQPAEVTDVKILFHRLAEGLRKRTMIVLISDLLADAADVVSGLEHISHSGHELIVFHVLDDDEWNMPFVENALFEGLEDSQRLLADPQSLRTSYLAVVERFVARVKGACIKHRADYVPVNTRDPLVAVLSGYLARRAGIMAVGRK